MDKLHPTFTALCTFSRAAGVVCLLRRRTIDGRRIRRGGAFDGSRGRLRRRRRCCCVIYPAARRLFDRRRSYFRLLRRAAGAVIAGRFAGWRGIRQSDSIRRMRHDIANHLITINALLDDGQNEQARQYTHELQQTGVYQSVLGKCLNISADAFLSARFCRLRDSGITLDLDIELPAKTGIPDADLISAIGNLLDNAEEACRSTADRRISMSAKLSGEYLVITTENPYAGEHPQQRKRRIPELERGVGFHILRELAEKYDGEFTSQPDGGIFRTSLILKTGAASNA